MAVAVSSPRLAELAERARGVRRDIISMTYRAGSGHPGGSLSVTDLLVALFFEEMRVDPAQPNWADRDRLVLSKGHAAPALYAVMAQKGFLPHDELSTLRVVGSRLQDHVDRRKLPGVEASTGCLGQGVGMAVGMALDHRIAKRPGRVYAILGDGECQAGPTWEALMAAGHYQLDNLLVIVDRNGYETDGSTESIMGIEPLAEKLRAFRFETLEIDGHDFPQILGAFAHARATKGRPTAIVAKTVKGKGVSFMENTHVYHGKPPSKEEAERAMAELGGTLT
jgi:transketolase